MYERDAAADRRMADTPALLQYLPRILIYPVSGYALGALLLFTVLLWIGMQSAFGVALFAIAAPWVFHYAEAVIDQTAGGQATPPRFGGDMIYLGSSVRALRPLVGVGLIAGGYLLARQQGPAAELAVLAAGAFLFPAFMLVLTVENSVLAALNPLQLVPAIAGTGWVYLALCLILTLAAAASAFAVSGVALIGALLLSIYLWLMTFHLLGYVAFHRAAQLGLRVKVAAPTDESRRMEQQNQRLAVVLRNIDAALARKNFDDAGRALYADPGGPADVRLYHEELFEQLMARRKPELLHAQGQRLITQLLREKRVARALDIAESCFDAHRDFGAAQAAQAVTLAEAALLARRDGLFERLLRDAPARYGADPATVALAFLNAKFWCERRGDDAKAREILKPLLAHTAHPQHRQIAAYARALGVKDGGAGPVAAG